MMTMRDLKVFDGLTIVSLDGFKPAPEMATDEYGNEFDVSGIANDPPGSANWFCEQYGMSGDGLGLEGPGILWTDYAAAADEPWAFSVLVDSEEAAAVAELARAAGYRVEEVAAVEEPTVYGDGSGTVEILKHRDGWIVLEN